MAESTDRAISDSARRAVRALGCFFAVFLLVGLGAAIMIAGRPILRMIDARGWTPTTCEILSSRVRDHGYGETYSVDITYRYTVNGQTHTGTRYKFVGGSTSGYRRKSEAVLRLPPGTRVQCFVDPDDPRESVIVRGPTGDLAFGLVPLIFAVIGAIGLAAGSSRGPLARYFAPKPISTHVSYGNAPKRGRLTRLVPVHSRRAKAGGYAAFALFWNGIVSAFVYGIITGWQNKMLAVPLTLFLVPFVLIGAVLIVVAATKILELFNPIPHLIVSSNVVALGEELKLRWIIEGRAEKLLNLSLSLVGREEITYQRDSENTARDSATFITLPLAEESAPIRVEGSKASVTIPPTSMHSFDAPNNKIVWCIKLTGSVTNWPDIDDEFAIHVTPAR